MFLLRSAFWLTVVILLIPADPETGEAPRVTLANAVSAVQATVADLAGFCDRNADVCVTGGAAVEMVAAKAEAGMDALYRLLGGGDHPADDNGIDMAPGASGTPSTPVRGTLSPGDLTLPWQGGDDPA